MNLGQKALKRKYKRVVKSIAFFPIIISIVLTALSFTVLTLEKNNSLSKIKEQIEFLLITDVDTVRTLMSSLIGGVISLTVFSFSMVMIVLSQASSNFSPRLLPGLVSNKKHQVILGLYIGTLLYDIIVLLYVKSSNNTQSSVGLSVFIAAFMGVLSVVFFVYFIHSISQSIQIQNIIQKIHTKAENNIASMIKSQKNIDLKQLEQFEKKDYICSNTNGYFQGIKSQIFINAFKDENFTVKIVPSLNQYVWENEVIAEVNQTINDATKEKLINCLDVTRNRHLRGCYFAELIKLNEIIVKAMSPGINDPGTAIDALNSLGAIMKKVKNLSPYSYINYENCNSNLIVEQVNIDILLKNVFNQIRLYSKHDPVVIEKIIAIFKLLTSEDSTYQNAFKNIQKRIEQDIKNNIDNEIDRKEIQQLLTKE